MVAILTCSAIALASGAFTAKITERIDLSGKLPECLQRISEIARENIKDLSCTKMLGIALLASAVLVPLSILSFFPGVGALAGAVNTIAIGLLFCVGYVLMKRGIDAYKEYGSFSGMMKLASELANGPLKEAKEVVIEAVKEVSLEAAQSVLDPEQIETIKQDLNTLAAIHNDLRASMQSGVSDTDVSKIVSAMRNKSHEIPQELRTLLQKYPEQKKLLEKYKETMASLEEKIEHAKKDLDNKTPQAIASIEAEANGKIKTMEELSQILETKNQEIDTHLKGLSEDKQLIETLISNLSAKLEHIPLTLAIAHYLPSTFTTGDTEKRIGELQEKVASIGKAMKNLEAQQVQVKEAQKKIKAQPAEIRKAEQSSKDKLREQSDELTALTEQKDSVKSQIKHMEEGFKLYTNTTVLQFHSFRLWESLLEGTTANFGYLFTEVGQDIRGKSKGEIMDYSKEIPKDLYNNDKSWHRPLERTQNPSSMRKVMEKGAVKRHPEIAQSLVKAVTLLSSSRAKTIQKLEAMRENGEVQAPAKNDASPKIEFFKALTTLTQVQRKITKEISSQEVSKNSLAMQKPVATAAAAALQNSAATSKQLLDYSSQNCATKLLATKAAQANPKLAMAFGVGSLLLRGIDGLLWGNPSNP